MKLSLCIIVFILSLLTSSNLFAAGCTVGEQCIIYGYSISANTRTSYEKFTKIISSSSCSYTVASSPQTWAEYQVYDVTIAQVSWLYNQWNLYNTASYEVKASSIDDFRAVMSSIGATEGLLDHFNSTFPTGPSSDFCAPKNQCTDKTGQVNYDLQNYSSPSSPPAGGNVCYDDCQQSAEILWTDCIGSSCIASVKYTATGQSCGVETSVDNLQTDPPKRCTDEINKKIQQCGGSLKVLSFDFETCSGQCTPDSCADQWKTLVNKCGGVMAVSTWDASTCSGTCVNDPLPNASQPDSEAVPTNVTTKKTTNPDGSSEVTNVTVYNVDGNPYAETTTITYDADGNETGKTTSTSTGSGGTGTGTGDTDTQYFSAIENSGFTEPYNPGEFDIPARFTTFLNNVKSSGLFSFSNDFFNSLPGGGSPIYEIEGGIFGSHSIDLSETMSSGLAVVKTVLLALFGFLSIRAVIMKR